MALTVKKLRQALKGIKGDTPIYLADHDHGTYETNGLAGSVSLLNQQKGDSWEIKRLDKDFEIKGDYVVIRVG